MFYQLLLGSRSFRSATVFMLFSSCFAARAQSQRIDSNTYHLSLAEAVIFAKGKNKWIEVARAEQSATAEDLKDVEKGALPQINASGSYQRFSNLTLFTDGLSHTNTVSRFPTANSAALGVEVLFNIYGGGKHRALKNEQNARMNLAEINTRDQSGNIALHTAKQYLDLLKLADLNRFIRDQLKRAQTRLKNINSLYTNQKVTKSDVLRAEVNLSNVELSLEQNENDMIIANQKLNILLDIPESVSILPADSAGMPKPDPAALQSYLHAAESSSFIIQKAKGNVEVQKARVRGTESNNKPSLSFYSAYGLNYPNYLFFPPIDQAYAVGFVGLKAQYNISSLYQNKNKVSASKIRVKELEIQQEAVADEVHIEVNAYYIKYREALNRITVNQHSVEQAAVNYKILTTKYLNQLALLTDLLDADNLYQESRFNLVRAQTDALSVYYQLLYTSGNL